MGQLMLTCSDLKVLVGDSLELSKIQFTPPKRTRYRQDCFVVSGVDVCMGMGKTGIPWVPWDSHGNGSKIDHGMGMGWEWELSAWEWELRRESCHQQL